ncbi:MAG: beta-glucosidase [Pigmentiphaga sp.]|uniref:beta-glucosidase n=1 Tax=Pigmentiphaga sp. TaxID=1977564 RepID=UPI0029B2ABEB|nr:beta-glucosidase [Pigmentiphaga sp.]MDX3905163.1 beta-glucosidase [Pigmentiphaga sp.]
MEPLFESFFQAGFECSTHRRKDGRRLDLIASTGHDRFARQDYTAVAGLGLRTVRDGIRWHLVEASAGRYDWSSFLPMLRAARSAGVQPVWDLCHYGWPDHIDIWRPAFVDRFAAFAAAVATVVRNELPGVPFYCPINEISFWAWAGGDVAYFNPGTERRGLALKQQLVRAALAAIEAIRRVDARARIVHADPAIHVMAGSPRMRRRAANADAAQYQAWDMISGKLMPGLGGKPEYLDIVGVNYYPDNQWIYDGPKVRRGHARYRPLREMLLQVHARYGRPMFVAETGAEGDERADWFAYVCDEVAAAMAQGVPLHGVCLYPILDYPGWENERHCPAGLLGAADRVGRRPVQAELAAELARRLGYRNGRVPIPAVG